MTAEIAPLLVAVGQPNTRLRWYAQRYEKASIRGRAIVMGTGRELHPAKIQAVTVQKMIRAGLIEPVDERNRRAFDKGGAPYRDYRLTPTGQRIARESTENTNG